MSKNLEEIDRVSWILLVALALWFCANAAYRMFEAYWVMR